MIYSSTGLEITNQIVAKAKSLGASLAGVANVDLLKQSPSHLLWPQLEKSTRVESRETAMGIKPGEVAWPQRAKSAVVIALEHGEAEPELDWWHGENSPPGNRILMKINKALSAWIEETFQITTHELAYHVERGGIFLKDSAVLAGLGCIGKSNILVTPELGPRVRLRAMLLEQAIAPTGPIDFDPCDGCSEPCRQACPKMAFNKQIFSPMQMGSQQLPGRSGCFSRPACNQQMKADIDAGVQESDPESGQTEKIIKYCRRCELACPAGSRQGNLKH
ncbi:MAG: epoxyqueuosine reductase [Desulfobacteraceae bacterium]